MGQQVPGQLPGRKLVERHVPVERRNGPVPPRPEVPIVRIVQETIGIGIARYVQPLPRHVFAVGFRGQKPVHELLVCIPAGIVDERVHFVQRRWESGQGQAHPVDQRLRVCFFGWREPNLPQPVHDKPVDLILGPV